MSEWIPTGQDDPALGEIVDVVVRLRNGHRRRIPDVLLDRGGIWRHAANLQPIATVQADLATVTHWMPLPPLPRS